MYSIDNSDNVLITVCYTLCFLCVRVCADNFNMNPGEMGGSVGYNTWAGPNMVGSPMSHNQPMMGHHRSVDSGIKYLTTRVRAERGGGGGGGGACGEGGKCGLQHLGRTQHGGLPYVSQPARDGAPQVSGFWRQIPDY